MRSYKVEEPGFQKKAASLRAAATPVVYKVLACTGPAEEPV